MELTWERFSILAGDSRLCGEYSQGLTFLLFSWNEPFIYLGFPCEVCSLIGMDFVCSQGQVLLGDASPSESCLGDSSHISPDSRTAISTPPSADPERKVRNGLKMEAMVRFQ